MTEHERKTANLPLAVWPCSQTISQWQRHQRYVAASNRHPAKMLPMLARRAIETYSDPGDLVVDPMCGIGTTLVEAAAIGRRATGVELEPRWAKLAEANIEHAHGRARAHNLTKVIVGDARGLPRLLNTRATRLLNNNDRGGGDLARIASGAADLILTSPPYACSIADLDVEQLRSGAPGPLRRQDTSNYSPDRANLGHARGSLYLSAMGAIYEACAAVLRPGGYLVVVTKDMRSGGRMHNLSGDTITLCQEAGLRYWQRIISLLATVRGDELVMRPSFWQTLHARRRRARGERTLVVAHEDVLVLRKPAGESARDSIGVQRRRA